MNLEDFRGTIDGSQIGCAESGCGWNGHSITRHLREVHSMTAADYKKKHGRTARMASRLVTELVKTMPRTAQRSSNLGDFAHEFEFPLGADVDLSGIFAEIGKHLGPVPEPLQEFIPEVDEHFVFDEPQARHMAYGILRGANIYDSGPTGCGKTAKFLQLLAQSGQAIRRVNMNGDVTPANFIGHKRAEEGRTIFDYGVLPQCMIGDGTRGIPLLVDEIDYCPPHIAAVMNPVLESGERVLYISETGETIRANPGFSIIATANTGGRGDRLGNYTGTEILNSAFLDRFGVKITSGYLPPTVETEMLRARYPKETEADVEIFVKGANLVREAFESGNINVTLSTRKLIDYFHAKDALGADDALALTLLNWTDTDDGATIRELLVRSGVQVATI